MKQTQSFDRPMFTPASLRRLIIPLIIEQMLAVTVGLADTVMIASVGEAAVSGVSLVNSLNNLIISILAALCTGGAVVCAQYLGRQDVFNARSSAKQLVYVSLFFTVVVGAVLLSSRNFFIRVLFGEIEADVHANASTYLLLTSLSFPFLAVYNACAALFRSMGNSRVSLFASAIMNIINVGGNALLIYGCGLGVAGAGTVTCGCGGTYACFDRKSRQCHPPAQGLEGAPRREANQEHPLNRRSQWF
jgi:Na+-driven multidrug efflux pump